MSQQLDEFMGSTRPAKRRSVLHLHALEIHQLHNRGYSWQQVADYLKESAGVSCHRNSVRDWWKRQHEQRLQVIDAVPTGTCACPGAGSGTAPPSAPARVGNLQGDALDEQGPSQQVAHVNALDDLLNHCQHDLPGMPLRGAGLSESNTQPLTGVPHENHHH